MPRMEVESRTLLALAQSEAAKLTDYSIGLVQPMIVNGAPDARLGGSGTLVAIDNVPGILTANHVIKFLRTNKYLGFVLPSAGNELHNVSCRMDDCSDVSLCPEGAPIDGPDLGILFPPPDVLSTIQAKKSFYNLSKRQKRMLDKPAPLEHGIWILSGFAGEWTGDGDPKQGFAKVKFFRGMQAAGKVARECSLGGFDYLFFEALYNEHYGGPDSFGGFSGGGLWQILVKAVGTELQAADRLLSGVAFYQSDKKYDGGGQITRDIKCHGRRSLYDVLINRVGEELST